VSCPIRWRYGDFVCTDRAGEGASGPFRPVELRAQIGRQLRGVGRPPAAAVKLGALLDGQRYVMDVALDVGGGLQGHRPSSFGETQSWHSGSPSDEVVPFRP